jgi:predicted alpha/beta-fold hydrolase
MEDFTPPAALRNAHVMTLAAAFWPRRFPFLPPSLPREFHTEPETRLLTQCHWQRVPREHPTLLIVHGLEGSAESGYMLGAAEKAWQRGFNVVRLNQRNCGRTEHWTPTLYNSGLSGDLHAILSELIVRDLLPEIFAVGFSMGGNLALKMAAEFGAAPPKELRGVATVCPAMDLAECAAALERPGNFLYQNYFVRRLKRRYRWKAKLFPEKYSLEGLDRVRTVRDFDNRITAPHCGYLDAADYYARASARPHLRAISVSTLLLTAQDDPVVPFASFKDPAIAANPHLQLDAPRFGGHCSFIASVHRGMGNVRFWSEQRLVEFCAANSRILSPAESVPIGPAAATAQAF